MTQGWLLLLVWSARSLDGGAEDDLEAFYLRTVKSGVFGLPGLCVLGHTGHAVSGNKAGG